MGIMIYVHVAFFLVKILGTVYLGQQVARFTLLSSIKSLYKEDFKFPCVSLRQMNSKLV